MEKTTIKIRIYGRMELALLYYPKLISEAAWRKLKAEINLNPQLSKELKESGYDGHHRSFTPYQVERIFYYLGMP